MDHSHGTSSMLDMAVTTASSMAGMNMGTATAASAAATATKAAAMGMGGGSSCKISMLWNWTTIDACFISRSWHITSKGMFAGSCIGVILLVMSLEAFRRLSREYDSYILRQAVRANASLLSSSSSAGTSSPDGRPKDVNSTVALCAGPVNFRPNVLQQMVRATLHMVQFTIAYFVMLLAMYYNGYIIISIIIGAWLGAFVFSWGTIGLSRDNKQEATICCG
ncbi:high affinity copper transporter [Amylocarpus encephaloides]|uniref:Copper transport protein n=1 Tax=Amylocarpus encephaloides TaxID=45428 RepID=A0A9P8C613_9HELO|nr:high affinity copper transporter [Amylocarpus encephaloides]